MPATAYVERCLTTKQHRLLLHNLLDKQAVCAVPLRETRGACPEAHAFLKRQLLQSKVTGSLLILQEPGGISPCKCCPFSPHVMYTITRGPSKLTTQRRTGPKQQIDTKLQELKSKQQLLLPTLSNGWDPLPSPATPKLVFSRVNGKRSASLSPTSEEEVYTPAHEENVRFVYQAWQEVQHQLERPELNGCRPQQYQDPTPNPSLKNFVPIDLEDWWAERFLANIENCA